MTTKASQVRKAVFAVRPEWKNTRRVNVSIQQDIIVVKLMVGLLDPEIVNTFNVHGSLYHNYKKIEDELAVELGTNVRVYGRVDQGGKFQSVCYKFVDNTPK